MTQPPRNKQGFMTHAVGYVDSILSRNAAELQVLLCDEACRETLSTVYTQQKLLANRVVLVDALGNHDDRYLMKHLHCVVLCRPSSSNINDLSRELQHANFGSYRVFFTNTVTTDSLRLLVNADVFNAIVTVEEVFLDVTPVSEHTAVISLEPPKPKVAWTPPPCPLLNEQWSEKWFARVTSGILASALMAKRRPVIRYRADNPIAARIAKDVGEGMKQLHLSFPDLKARDAVLIIADRLDDPVTPLLTQWTYEAMIHELIGLKKWCEVVLDGSERVEERTHVLTTEGDPFFGLHRFHDYGALCIAVSDLVETYKSLNNFDRTSATMDDIKNFFDRFPEAKKQSSQVTRHAAILGRLVDEVNSRNLTRLSVLEQDMCVSSSASEHAKSVLDIVRSPMTDLDDAVRLAMQYNLKYEKSATNVVKDIKAELENRGCPPAKLALIDRIIDVAGSRQRLHEIYKTSTGSYLKTMVNSIAQFGSEVQNVLTQHQPLLKKIVNRAYNGTLAEKDYPVMPVQGSPYTGIAASTFRARDVFVFMMGGFTCEEVMLVHNLNEGTVDNNTEALMNLGGKVTGVGRLLTADAEVVVAGVSGGSSAADSSAVSSSEPVTDKIEARVFLTSNAVVNSTQFMAALRR